MIQVSRRQLHRHLWPQQHGAKAPQTKKAQYREVVVARWICKRRLRQNRRKPATGQRSIRLHDHEDDSEDSDVVSVDSNFPFANKWDASQLSNHGVEVSLLHNLFAMVRKSQGQVEARLPPPPRKSTEMAGGDPRTLKEREPERVGTPEPLKEPERVGTREPLRCVWSTFSFRLKLFPKPYLNTLAHGA